MYQLEAFFMNRSWVRSVFDRLGFDVIWFGEAELFYLNHWCLMYSGSGESSESAKNDAPAERTNVLAICLSGTHALACALQATLQPAQNVEFVQLTLPHGDSHKYATLVRDFLARYQSSILLLCVSNERAASWEIVFETVRKSRHDLPIIVILETAERDQLPRLLDMGAADFCLAPLRLEELLPRVLRWSSSISPTKVLVRQLENELGLQQLLGESRAFLEAMNKLPKLARCDASLFITGETGTGKEMCARTIHHLGPRANQPFVPVNCGAIPSELVENELFGHDAGAFTGACSTVRGLVHDAEEGTLFLDEIDSLPLHTQVKLLRFLQDQEYRPLGARKTFQADVRIIAASNANVEEVVRSGKFRADLFFRLNVLPLKLPPLRERPEDIPLLARHFVAKYAQASLSVLKVLSRTALEKLFAYDWPGNVRELENIIERALFLSEHPMITAQDISLPETKLLPGEASFKVLKARAIADFETSYVRQLLAASDGNISKAARTAKKNRRAFWQLMRKHDILAPARVLVR
jgi:two-component system response regulator GlrR